MIGDDLRAFMTARLDEVYLAIRDMEETTPPEMVQVLRIELGAKRKILELWRQARTEYHALADQRARSQAQHKPEPSDRERRAMDMGDAYERVVQLLAMPYVVHPDFPERWLPPE